MSTQTAEHPADVKKGAPEPPPRVLAKCPNCGELVLFDELVTYVPQEFPKLLYKEKPKAAKPKDPEPEPEVETVVVQNADEEKKKESEGWSKDVPQPKAPEHSHKAAEPPHPQGTPKPDEKKK
jgi:hypothetical protein